MIDAADFSPYGHMPKLSYVSDYAPDARWLPPAPNEAIARRSSLRRVRCRCLRRHAERGELPAPLRLPVRDDDAAEAPPVAERRL